ncbi:MAG: hypothetical protein AAF400_02565 [Bacteroidota bacterium]
MSRGRLGPAIFATSILLSSLIDNTEEFEAAAMPINEKIYLLVAIKYLGRSRRKGGYQVVEGFILAEPTAAKSM